MPVSLLLHTSTGKDTNNAPLQKRLPFGSVGNEFIYNSTELLLTAEIHSLNHNI